MHVLFCGGSPKAPSWAMRGVQIASADANWAAINEPGLEDIRAADVVVVVKRFKNSLISRIHACGKKIVWDALDFWPQSPEVEGLPQDLSGAVLLARSYYDRIRPHAVICANQKMAEDFGRFAKRAAHIYHHARLDARPLPFGKVAWYDGCEKHAEKSLGAAQDVLEAHGWRLRIGKPQGEAGMLLGIRDIGAGTWLADRWKSNVKAANAIAYNLLFVAGAENGYMETLPEFFPSIENCLFTLESGYDPSYAARCEPVTLEHAAAQYRAFFEAL